jgi:hypothetical protein
MKGRRKATPRPDGGSRSRKRAVRNSQSEAYINLSKTLCSVFSAGVYTKEELQGAVCNYVTEMKAGGETGDSVVRAAQGLVNDVSSHFPASNRTQVLLADMVTWCLAEYYRESA